jgi:hypothetical protein
MSRSVDRELERAYALGVRNREVLELLGQHCRHAVVEFAGGHGMAEQASGLPIDMRTIRCSYAKNPVGSAMNMEWIAVEFYRANCVGCPHRQPVGVPNLATFVAGLDEAAARGAEDASRHAEAVQRRRTERAARRAMTAVGEPLAAMEVLNDLDIVDAAMEAEPGAEEDLREGARRRIVETARLAPEAFTPAVVDQLRELAPEPSHSWAFEALRHLARAGHADVRETITLALEVLAAARRPEASHVLVDLQNSVTADDLSADVMSALIHLAGAPQLHGLTGAFSRGRTRDRAGLLMAVEVSVASVLSTLGEMLQSMPGIVADPPPELWLPPGIRRRVDASRGELDRDEDRAAAAVASRVVLTAVPYSAGVLGPQLLEALRIPDSDDYISATSEIVETLAGLLLEQPDLALSLITVAGANSGEEQRGHIFDIAERAARRLRAVRKAAALPGDVAPQQVDYAGDFPNHRLGVVDAKRAAKLIFSFTLDRLGGDWGHDVAGDAGRLIETIVGDHAAELGGDANTVDAVIGHLIATAEDPRRGSALDPPGPLAALEQMTRDQTRYSIMRELRQALRALAAGDPGIVLDRVEPILDAPLPTTAGARGDDALTSAESPQAPPTQEERAALDLREQLVTLLGDLGRDGALSPGVLRRVLPRLTTHLLGQYPQLRAAAIKAWREAGRGEQPLPSTLSDCMPVLLTDTYLIVIGALLDVLPSVLYDSENGDGLALMVLQWALAVEPSIRAQRNDRERDVVWVLRAVARRFEDPVQTQVLGMAFGLGEHLSPYELRHHLDSQWPAAISRSTAFARQCVRALGRPEIHDDHDEIITLLLDAWPGSGALSDDEIASLLADVKPEYPLMGADALELLGRIGRYSAASVQAERILGAVPNVPAADRARAIAGAMQAATRLELAVTGFAAGAQEPSAVADVKVAADGAETAVQRMTSELDREDPRRAAFGLPSGPPGPVTRMSAAMVARVAAVRALIRMTEAPMGAEQTTAAAVECESAAAALRGAYPAAIPTAAAYERYAEALDVIACLARADAATRSADAQEASAQLDAGHRRAAVLSEQLGEVGSDGTETGGGDPLTDGVASLARRACVAGIGGTAGLAHQLLQVALPLRVIEGPRRHGFTARADGEQESEEQPDPVVVCLLSLDDHPLTEHAQVLHPDQVYTLTVDARGLGWPVWADRLELEPISSLTEVELTLPTFQVDRPGGLAENGDYQLAESGALVLRFALAPGRPAVPVRLTGRFTGISQRAEDPGARRRMAVDVAGHPQVRLRPFDPTRDMFTDYPQVDARLLELFGRLHGKFPDDQLDAFARFLTAIVLAAERIQFDKAYKLGARVSEATFHDDLEVRLRDDPALGGRLTRRDARALGFLDLDHDGINAELKVERTTPVTQENCHKYLGQPAQYATGANRRLSILVVLDMSRKQAPPGTLENYVWLMQPSEHGLSDPAHTAVVAVVVINANNRVPSGWSRHRIDAAPVDAPRTQSVMEEPPGAMPEGSSG